MTNAYALAALWLGLAVLSTILANHLRVSMALVEICVGIAAGTTAARFFGPDSLGANVVLAPLPRKHRGGSADFPGGCGALKPAVLRAKWKEVTVVGLVGFAAPFLGCAAACALCPGVGEAQASWLAGVSLSTTSMAVVYAVMLETGFNKTDFGKGILGACFINDLGTVIALGLLFAPFTYKTVVFVLVTVFVLAVLPFASRWLSKTYANHTNAVKTKWVILTLFALGALAFWSGSEAVLPAYLVGMVLAEFSTNDVHWIRRMRTLTVGFLTPFYFLRAGTLVSPSGAISAPVIFLCASAGQGRVQDFRPIPRDREFQEKTDEHWYYTLMMSTGLTFGTISALYGLSHVS